MIELLKQLLIPGGIITAIFTWWATTHTKKGEPKTSVEDSRKDDARRAIEDSGISQVLQEYIKEERRAREKSETLLREEIHQIKVENEEYREGNALLYGYAWSLRAQVTVLGGEPERWPPRINPNNK